MFDLANWMRSSSGIEPHRRSCPKYEMYVRTFASIRDLSAVYAAKFNFDPKNILKTCKNVVPYRKNA